MLVYCLKCKKKAKTKNSTVEKTDNGKIILLLNSAIGDTKNLRFIEEQEAIGLLSTLGIKTPLRKLPLESHLFRGISKLIQGTEWVK